MIEEQAASERHRLRIVQLENETQKRSAAIEELSRRERGFEEKCREQVRSHKIVTDTDAYGYLVGTGVTTCQKLCRRAEIRG